MNEKENELKDICDKALNYIIKKKRLLSRVVFFFVLRIKEIRKKEIRLEIKKGIKVGVLFRI